MQILNNKPRVNTLMIIIGCLLLYFGISLDKLMASDTVAYTEDNKLSYVTLEDGNTLDIYRIYDTEGNELFRKDYKTSKINGTLQFKRELDRGYEYIINYDLATSDNESYYIRQLALFMYSSGDYLLNATSNPEYILTEARALSNEAHSQKSRVSTFNANAFTHVGEFYHLNELNDFEHTGYIFNESIVNVRLEYPDTTVIYDANGDREKLAYNGYGVSIKPELTVPSATFKFIFTFRIFTPFEFTLDDMSFIGVKASNDIELNHSVTYYKQQKDTDGNYQEVTVRDARTDTDLTGLKALCVAVDDKGRTMIPDENGKIALMDSTTLIQTIAPSGYALQSESINHDCSYNHTGDIYFTHQGKKYFHNAKLSTIKIKYIDKETGDAMHSCKFSLYNKDGSFILEDWTNGSGYLFLNKLPEGTYYLKQHDTRVPNTIKDRLRIENRDGSPTILVEYIPNDIPIEIKAQESDGTPISGVKFSVSPGNKTGTTNSSGILEFTVKPDTYTVTNTEKPANHGKLGSQQIQINHLDPVDTPRVLTFNFKRDERDVEITSLDDVGNPIPNVTYQIEPTSKIITTNSEGKASVKLPYNTYTFTKTSVPRKYQILEPNFQLTINSGSPPKVSKTSTDKIKKGSVLITNKSLVNNTPITGARFGVFDSENHKITDGITGRDGTVTLQDIPYGNYKVKEISTITGFKPNITEHNIFINQDGMTVNVNAYNDVATANITVKSVDDDNSEPINGVMLGLYASDGSTLVDSSYTDDNGSVTFSDIPVGNYKIKQINQPNEYLSNSTVTDVTISDATPKSVEMRYIPVKGKITINTKDSENISNIPNVDIEITPINSKETETLTINTGVSGSVQTRVLRYGDYSVRVTNIGNNYHENTSVFPASITSNDENVVIDIPNNPVKFKLKIIMRDGDTANPLKGAQFEIHQNGIPITNGGQTRFITNEHGEIVLTEDLRAGTYKLVEKQTSIGYIGVNPTDFTIDKSTNLTDGTYVITLDNQVIRGSVEFTLTDSDLNKTIQGASIELWGKPNNINTFTLDRFDRDTLISTHTTNGDGKITVDDLPYGAYFFKIKTLPTEYGPNTDVIEFNITSDGKESISHEIGSVSGSITINIKDAETGDLIPNSSVDINGSTQSITSGTITLNKSYGDYTITANGVTDEYVLNNSPKVANIRNDGDNITIDITHTKKRSDIHVKVKDNKGNPVPSSQIKINNDKVYQVTNGVLVLTDMLYGSYTLEQIQVNNGYVLNPAQVSVNIETDGDVYDVDIVNTKIEGNIKISVKDSVTNELIDGATVLLDGSPKLVAGGEITIPNVSYGTHTIVQQSTSNGYKINSEPKIIDITNNGDTHEVSILNEPIQANIHIRVKDIDTENNITTTLQINNESHTLSNGTLTLRDVAYGMYTISQKQVEEGYILNEDTFTINVDGSQEDYHLTINNDIIKGSVKVSVVDSETNTPLPNVSIKLDNNQPVTLQDGTIVIDNVRYGSHTISQVSANPQYSINANTFNFSISNSDSTEEITIPNDKINGSLEVYVKDKETGELLSDVELEINGDKYTTENGVVSLNNLNSGKYTIKQLKTKEGYRIDPNPRVINITNSEKQSIEILNEKRKVNVLIRSVDTNTKAPLSGVEYDILNTNKEVVTSITTDSRGRAEFELDYGSYEIKETKPPKNYLPNNTNVDLDIGDDDENVRKVIESSKNLISGGAGNPNTGTVSFNILIPISILLFTGLIIFYRYKK